MQQLFCQPVCKKEKDDDNDSTKGELEFKCYNPLASISKKSSASLESHLQNPRLTGDTTETFMTSMKIGIGDVWVSQGIVEEGAPDDLEWIRLTSSTNTQLKLWEDYSFPVTKIPVGEYKSIKINFRFIFYRIVRLKSDPSVVYELLETMGSSTDPCNPNDQSWQRTNYFGPGGNFFINDESVFELASSGEKVGGFTIESDKKAVVTWRLGAGATDPCTFYLFDLNGNREWDCGTDDFDVDRPPTVEQMWDFVVDYED